jgi:hypothetical protein
VNVLKPVAQAHEILDVRKNGAFIFSDILLIDYRQQKLANLLSDIKMQAHQLYRMLKKYTHGDERLLGQEKANIVNVLHMIIRNLAALYLRLFDMEHAAEYHSDIEISEGKDGFLIKGRMDADEVNVRFSLRQWTDEYFEAALADLFKDFQDAAKDHVITLAEKVELNDRIARLLVKTMQAFYVMRSGAVFR